MANGLPEYQQREQVSAGQSPLRTFQSPSNPISPDLSVVGKALSGIGDEIGKVAAKVSAGQQSTKVSQGLESFIGKNYALKNKYAASPDYDGAEQGFRDEIDAAKRDALSDITDPTLREQTSLQMERMAIVSQGSVRAAQLARQKGINDTSLETVKATAANETVTAPSAAERHAAADTFVGQVSRLAAVGWLDETSAVAHLKDFNKKVDLGDATVAIKADPGQAIGMLAEPKMFPALDVAQRGELFHAAYTAEWADDRAAVSAPVSESLDHVGAGTLTPEWLAAQRGAMSAIRADALARTIAPASVPNPDPAIHAGLLHQAAFDPEGAASDALTALADGRLDRAGFAHVVDTARKVDADTVARPWANDVRRELSDLVAAREAQAPASAARQAAALPAFENWLAENPDATRAEAQAQAAGFAAQSLVDAAKLDVSTMPLPRFATASRNTLDLSHVGDAAGRMRDARARGEMGDDDFVGQADLLARWNDALQQISKGGA